MREIASCKNFLQRKRSINLTLKVLLKFAQLFEMRRLICCSVFKKRSAIQIHETEEGMNIKCFSYSGSLLLRVNWTFSWEIEKYEVLDYIEFLLDKTGNPFVKYPNIIR